MRIDKDPWNICSFHRNLVSTFHVIKYNILKRVWDEKLIAKKESFSKSDLNLERVN